MGGPTNKTTTILISGDLTPENKLRVCSIVSSTIFDSDAGRTITIADGMVSYSSTYGKEEKKEEKPKEITLEEAFHPSINGFSMCTICSCVTITSNREYHIENSHKDYILKEEEEAKEEEVKEPTYRIGKRKAEEDYHPDVKKALEFHSKRLTQEEKLEIEALAYKALDFTLSQPIYLYGEKDNTMPPEFQKLLEDCAPNSKALFKAYFKYKEGWEKRDDYFKEEWKEGMFMVFSHPHWGNLNGMPMRFTTDKEALIINGNTHSNPLKNFLYYRRPELQELIAYFTRQKFMN